MVVRNGLLTPFYDHQPRIRAMPHRLLSDERSGHFVVECKLIRLHKKRCPTNGGRQLYLETYLRSKRYAGPILALNVFRYHPPGAKRVKIDPILDFGEAKLSTRHAKATHFPIRAP